MHLPVAQRWFERHRVDDAVTLLVEPHVVPLMRCNIWHVRGRSRHLVIDTGMGVVSLVDELRDLVDGPVTAVATHGHGDHIGGHHEFADVAAHPAEAAALAGPGLLTTLDIVEAWGADVVAGLEAAGYAVTSPLFVDALPPGYALDDYRQRPTRVGHLVDDGDVLDLGDRAFEVLHLPGHSPGSIGLWDAASRTLFSGDAVYDGPLLDELPGSDVDAYCATMRRLLTLPVEVVHGGHDPSFGRDRLQEICRDYLRRRG